jgi:putative phage-type endonuclease
MRSSSGSNTSSAWLRCGPPTVATNDVVSLASRRPLSIGGSEAAAACGLDPYRSRVMLWLEKTGRVARAETEAMRWGRALEPAILAEVVRRGYDYDPPPPEGITDPARPWLVGHPDGFTVIDGWPAVLEVTTANAYAGREWREDAGAPLGYIVQCQHYLELTGYAFALLACLVGGQRLELRVVHRDDDAIRRVLQLEASLLEHVRRDEPPPPDGTDSAAEALAALYPESQPGEVVRLDVAGWREYETLRARREQLGVLEQQVAALEQRLKARIGDASAAIGPNDEPVAKWTSYRRSSIDTAALRRALPAIAAEYETTTRLRRFTVE